MKTVVSIQGYRGSFHHLAAQKHFDEKVFVLEHGTFAEVFEDVLKKRASHGIVAAENTIAGSVYETYNLLVKYSKVLTITAELVLPIHQCLMALPDIRIKDVQNVYSHPMAILQCETFLRTHHMHAVATEDTAGSAKMLAQKKLRDSAAIAPAISANIYGLHILKKNIETNKKNYTRFLILESGRPKPTEKPHKTSLMLEVKHRPGSLAAIVNTIAHFGVNMTKLESRPIVGKTWEYRFFIDYEYTDVHAKEKELLKSIIFHTDRLVVLGSYAVE